jgi:hypothetical protein
MSDDQNDNCLTSDELATVTRDAIVGTVEGDVKRAHAALDTLFDRGCLGELIRFTAACLGLAMADASTSTCEHGTTYGFMHPGFAVYPGGEVVLLSGQPPNETQRNIGLLVSALGDKDQPTEHVAVEIAAVFRNLNDRLEKDPTDFLLGDVVSSALQLAAITYKVRQLTAQSALLRAMGSTLS